MPRPRFTLRWLMVAVAVAACLLGIVGYTQRLLALRSVYLSKAAYFEKHERLTASNLSGWGEMASEIDLWSMKMLPRYRSYKEKYQRAASRPWAIVAEDPANRYWRWDQEKLELVSTLHRPPRPWEPIPNDDDPQGW